MPSTKRHRLLAALALALACPSCFPDDSPRISIEYAMVPELEGADVLIDGKVVGKLEPTGQATRVSFPVKPGEHEVSIKSPQFDCQATKVVAEMKGQKVRLLASVGEMQSTSGKPMITFQY